MEGIISQLTEVQVNRLYIISRELCINPIGGKYLQFYQQMHVTYKNPIPFFDKSICFKRAEGEIFSYGK